VPFVGAAVGVEDDDAVIEISVGYVDFVRLRIDFRIGWTAKTRHVIAVGLLPRFADLQHKFAIARELQILTIVVSVTADPNEARCIDADACSFCGQS